MRSYLFSSSKKRQYLLLAGDVVIISIAIVVSYGIRVYLNQKNPTFDAVISKLNPWQGAVILIHVFALYLFDQYNLNQLNRNLRSSIMVVLSMGLAGLIISGLFFFLPKYVFGRQVLIIHFLVASVFMVLWRLLFGESSARETRNKRLVVIGGGQIVSSFIEEIAHITNSGFKVVDIFVFQNSLLDSCTVSTCAGECESLSKFLNSTEYDALAIDSTCGFLTDNEIRRILQLRFREKAVYDLPTLYKNLTGKVPLSFIDGRWLLANHGLQGELSIPYVRFKRLFDVMLSFAFIVITMPLFVVIAIATMIDSKGNVLFVQERLGHGKRRFRFYKFRTMVQNAEEKSGPVWSRKKDPRVTRVGRILRKTRLDELPQFWNILKGDMSFVGPRPIRDYFANRLAKKIPFYGLRFSVKPGLSGWAQVNHDYAGSEEGQLEKFQYELFYIQNISFFLDLLVIIKTGQKMFRGGGT